MEKVKIVKNFYEKNRGESIALIGVLLLGALFRLYRIAGYMTFLGDEGRDAIIVRRLIVEADLILIGPGTSIGNMFLGPLYYYLIAPSLLLFNFSPLGPSVFVALLGVATVFMIWAVGREWFSREAGLIAALLYAISPTAIIFSRSSWNPNVMPFFALLSVWAIWRVWQRGEYLWLLVLGVTVAFVLQTHYLGLLLIPTLGLFWILKFFEIRGEARERRKLIKFSIFGLLAFVFLMSPLVLFDLRHNFVNYYALRDFLTMRQTTVSARPWTALPDMWPLLVDVSTRLVGGRSEAIGPWVALGILGTGLVYLRNLKYRAFLVLFVWLGISLLGLGLLKQQIYDHYYGFFFPVAHLIVGGGLSYFISKGKTRGWWIAGFVLLFLVYFNLLNSPLRQAPNRQMERAQEIADLIAEDAGDSRFNLGVIAERNYEDGYQYFLERDRKNVVDIDALRLEETLADKLYVICEFSEKEKCDPTHSPKAEVANFGWSVIEREWDTFGVHVFRLGHSQ